MSDGQTLAYLGSDAKHSARIFRNSGKANAAPQLLAAETQPADFPAQKLITPQQVIFKSPDGLDIHGQLFLPKDIRPGEKRPGILFFHGGSMRQMLLGWHYMYYYSNSYAMNQYLASRGYVVLSVNYRSGIGYGRAFREAPGRAGRGASEYQDVVAAGKYMQARTDVNPARVGLWGGSYGGYLTALGLGRNSDIFAAGVDLHGVHDWPTDNWDGKNISPELTKLAHESSPVTAVDTWKSPVLFIHGDDDRNVYFAQTVDLVARLRATQCAHRTAYLSRRDPRFSAASFVAEGLSCGQRFLRPHTGGSGRPVADGKAGMTLSSARAKAIRFAITFLVAVPCAFAQHKPLTRNFAAASEERYQVQLTLRAESHVVTTDTVAAQTYVTPAIHAAEATIRWRANRHIISVQKDGSAEIEETVAPLGESCAESPPPTEKIDVALLSSLRDFCEFWSKRETLPYSETQRGLLHEVAATPAALAQLGEASPQLLALWLRRAVRPCVIFPELNFEIGAKSQQSLQPSGGFHEKCTRLRNCRMVGCAKRSTGRDSSHGSATRLDFGGFGCRLQSVSRPVTAKRRVLLR